METVREQWTDERLDDLKGEVGALRGEIRNEFRAVRDELLIATQLWIASQL